MKDQRITERVHAQFQFQAFNVTNHTNYAIPASAQTQFYSYSTTTNAITQSASAGNLTTYADFGRELQFALKILF